MFKSLLGAILLFLIFTGCSVEPLEPVEVIPTNTQVDFLNDVKPILDKRCVSCHSCYNSPCQLKLSSFEGLKRGSSKKEVYLAERLKAQDPTRLFIDAKNTQEWRDKGFSSVTDSSSKANTNNSIMLQLIEHKMKNPKSTGEYLSEEDLTCSENLEELSEFLDDHPNQGMPYGFPPLNLNEFNTIKQWLYQGAKSSPLPKVKDPSELKDFEDFFNNPHAKNVMSARYIYEHLFLAHLSFKSNPKEFYEIVRSSTPSPQPIDIIATLRPYDDPKVDKFYYRFRRVESTIVHKTHIVYDLSYEKLNRYKELFIEPKWNEKPYDVGYKTNDNAHPFKTFAQIPAKSRYEFLLDDSEYVIRTFIRGPVCKGQIALNVIHDHFWITFMNSDYDLSVKNNGFLKSQYENLELPTQDDSDTSLIETFTDKYNKKAINYYNDRLKLYDEYYKQGLDENSTNKKILTIFRHFDSASVHNGALGDIPRTMWIVDYPLMERIYYSLVAGFDIFGNVGHQVNIRRYMSRLRVEGESYFINLLPIQDREKTFKSWYINSEDDEIASFSNVEAKKHYIFVNSKEELIKSLVTEFDVLNYIGTNSHAIRQPVAYNTNQDYINGFKSLIDGGTSFVTKANGTNSNLAYIRIKNIPDREDVVISAVVNRWHDNVSFMFDEEDRLDSSKDSMDFIPGFVGSYPNLFLVLDYKDLPDFIDMMHHYNDTPEYIAKFVKYGVFREDPDFWEHFDWFQKRFYKDRPHDAGLFDLNRYYYKVLH